MLNAHRLPDGDREAKGTVRGMSSTLSAATRPHTDQRPPSARSIEGHTQSRFVRSAGVWLILMAFLGVVELFISFIGTGPTAASTGVSVWPVLAGVGVAGLGGIWLSDRTGFPSGWDARVSNRQRLLYPIMIGVGFGLLQVIFDELTHMTQFLKELTGVAAFNAAFPGSLFVYPGGAIILEVVYRLVPIPILLWLISNLARVADSPDTGVLEPGAGDVAHRACYPEFADLSGRRGGARHVSVRIRVCLRFHTGRVVPSVWLSGRDRARWGMYLVWHVTYGNFICQC
jgi:hypothetical protein